MSSPLSIVRPPPPLRSTLNSVPDKSKPLPAVYVVLVSAAAIVTVSEPAFVVIVTLAPPAKVSVSVPESATTLDCPDTAIVLKVSAAPPPPTRV